MVKRSVIAIISVFLCLAVLGGCNALNLGAKSSKPVGYEVLDPLTDYNNEQGIKFMEGGQYKVAILMFNEAIGLEPKVGYLYRNRGLAYDGLGDKDSAIKDFTKAIALNKDDYHSYFYRGYDYSLQGAYDQAMADLNKAVELNPRDGDSYGERGAIYASLKQYDKAIEDYTRSIDIEPHAITYYNRGFAHYSRKEYVAAIADDTKAIALNPKSAKYYYDRGTTYSIVGDNARALADLSKAIELNPAYDWAYFTRGQVHVALGNKGMAILDFRAVISNTKDQFLIDQARKEIAAVEQGLAPSKPSLTSHMQKDAAISLGPALEPSLVYDNCTYGIRIKYPAGWTIREGIASNVVVFDRNSSENFPGTLAILVRDLPDKSMTLDEFVRQSYDLPQGWQVTSTTTSTLAGFPAYRVEMNAKVQNGNLKFLEFITLRNTTLYYVTYMAEQGMYSDFLKTAQQMIDSFEITPGPSSKATLSGTYVPEQAMEPAVKQLYDQAVDLTVERQYKEAVSLFTQPLHCSYKRSYAV